MEIPEHCKWMVRNMDPDRQLVTDEFMVGVVEFIEFAYAQENYKKEEKLRCLSFPLMVSGNSFFGSSVAREQKLLY
jgi:hypothetical protein